MCQSQGVHDEIPAIQGGPKLDLCRIKTIVRENSSSQKEDFGIDLRLRNGRIISSFYFEFGNLIEIETDISHASGALLSFDGNVMELLLADIAAHVPYFHRSRRVTNQIDAYVRDLPGAYHQCIEAELGKRVEIMSMDRNIEAASAVA